ncbi:hypothetical protein PMAYCL1PPCAC_09182, partial [Pristionchus mayeri]
LQQRHHVRPEHPEAVGALKDTAECDDNRATIHSSLVVRIRNSHSTIGAYLVRYYSSPIGSNET